MVYIGMRHEKKRPCGSSFLPEVAAGSPIPLKVKTELKSNECETIKLCRSSAEANEQPGKNRFLTSCRAIPPGGL